MTLSRLLVFSVLLSACGPANPEPAQVERTRYRAGLVLVLAEENTTTSTGLVFEPKPQQVDLSGYFPDGTCQEATHRITLRSTGVSMMEDVGESMFVEAGATSLPVARTTEGVGAISYSSTHPVGLPGDAVRVRWPQASPAFEAELIRLPRAPSGMPARLEAAPGQTLELRWDAGEGDLMLVSFITGETPITCAFADLGRGVVPAATVAKLVDATEVRFTRFFRREAEWFTDERVAYDVIGVGARSVSRPFVLMAKRLFVTNSEFEGTFALGETSAVKTADRHCQQAADTARLGGTFHAYLANSVEDPMQNVVGDGPWHLLDRRTVVGDRSTLLDSELIARDEYDTLLSRGWFWRGGVGNHCEAWTDWRGYGAAHALGSGSSYQYTLSCSSAARFLCLEE